VSGDIVLRVNDRPVGNRAAADAAIQALRPGEEVRIRLVRDGQVEDRIVVVGNRASAFIVPKIEAPEAWVPGGPGQQVLGLRWVSVPEDLRAAWGAPKDAGVVVARVAPDGAAAKAGVKVGDVVVRVNGVPMTSADEVPYLAHSSAVRLEVVRRGAPKPLELQLDTAPGSTPAPPARRRTLGDAERRRLETEIEQLREEVRRLSEELKRERSAQ
jgi:S1-C subfamily serine protease